MVGFSISRIPCFTHDLSVAHRPCANPAFFQFRVSNLAKVSEIFQLSRKETKSWLLSVVDPRFTDAASLSKSGRLTRVKLANLTVNFGKSPVKITALPYIDDVSFRVDFAKRRGILEPIRTWQLGGQNVTVVSMDCQCRKKPLK